VIGPALAHNVVAGTGGVTAGKAGNHFVHADELLEHGLGAPETAAG